MITAMLLHDWIWSTKYSCDFHAMTNADIPDVVNLYTSSIVENVIVHLGSRIS